VQGSEVVELARALHLHQLDRQQQHAGAVVADHGLGQPVRILGAGAC